MAPANLPAVANRWSEARTWIAIAGLALLIAGAVLLIPRGDSIDFSDTQPADFSLPTIVVDAGHGGHDNGASRNGLREKDLTLDTALRLEKKLRALGFSVVLTRRDDRFVDLTERAALANRIPRALFVSIHFNDNVTVNGEGIETYFASEKVVASSEGWSFASLFREHPEPPPEDNGRGFADAVQTSIIGSLKAINRGVKPGRYVVLRHTRCPAVLVEGGFINNPTQAREVSRPAYRETLASAIATGVQDYQRQRNSPPRNQQLARATP